MGGCDFVSRREGSSSREIEAPRRGETVRRFRRHRYREPDRCLVPLHADDILLLSAGPEGRVRGCASRKHELEPGEVTGDRLKIDAGRPRARIESRRSHLSGCLLAGGGHDRLEARFWRGAVALAGRRGLGARWRGHAHRDHFPYRRPGRQVVRLLGSIRADPRPCGLRGRPGQSAQPTRRGSARTETTSVYRTWPCRWRRSPGGT